MEVLCLSYIRTGTASMQAALNHLGMSCFHSFSLFSYTTDCAIWVSAFEAKIHGNGTQFTNSAEWNQLLAEYSAIADVPAIAFSEELIAAYSKANLVLMEGDIDKWYMSFDDAVIKNFWKIPLIRWRSRIVWLDPCFARPVGDIHVRWARDWMGVDSTEEMRMKARVKCLEHYELIRRIVPKRKVAGI